MARTPEFPTSIDAASQSARRPSARFLPHLLSAALLLLSLGITYSIWNTADRNAVQELQSDFDFRVRETAERITQRMGTYEQVMRSTQAMLGGSFDISRAEYARYVAALELDRHFPGIQGLALAEIVPAKDKDRHIASVRREGLPNYNIRPEFERAQYSSISKIEPFTGLNLRALGFDMLTDPVRRAAMEQARDSGQPALSGKLKLVQETGTRAQPGVVMYLPVFKRGMPTQTVEQRRDAILGWVGGPFRMHDLMEGIGGERSEELRLKIYDGQAMTDQTRLFDSGYADTEETSHAPLFSSSRQIHIAGHPWTLAIDSGPAFEANRDQSRSLFIALAGIGASFLLATLVWILATGRRRALALANAMTSELRASEYRWKYALEGSGDGVWDWNIPTSEVGYSRRWKEMLGYSESEIENSLSQWEKLVHPDDQGAVRSAIQVYLAERSPAFAIEFRMRCKDGSWKWILSRGTIVLRDAGHRPLRMIGTHSDITARKEAEHLEAERNQALEETRTALHHAQKLEAVGKLTGGVAHDFNNVLQIIGGNLNLLEYFVADKPQAAARVASALSAVDRGAKLSSQLLSFARRQPLEPRVVNLREVINSMSDMLRQAVGESVELQVTVGERLWNTLVDPNRLENVILNLVLNAYDAMRGEGTLSIELGNATLDSEYAEAHPDVVAGEYALLVIRDTGSGMTSSVREHAFEPFFTTKLEGEGTGLGLSTAYGFVKQSGGHIELESEVGAGTTFKIYLPRSMEQETVLPETFSSPSIGGSETILVVEDDLDVQASVVAMLTELGYKVLKADAAESALRIVRSGTPIDLLFTDVVMPGALRGPDLAKKVKELMPEIAVLFTSGYTQNALMQSSRLDPAVTLLSKPYQREQLAQKIRAVLASSRELSEGSSTVE